jgi:hypothetical protein
MGGALMLSLLGCGNQAAVDAANAFAEDVCACKKLSCAQEMSQKHSEKLKSFEDARGSEDDKTKILDAGKRAQACITKLREGAKP